MKSNKLSSVDETINYLILHENDKIKDMETVSTKTFYNYIHAGKVKIKPIDLPRMLRRKSKKNDKTYISKRQKGTSITERPEHIESREEFGHWEGDLVVGPRNGQNGAYLTLIERKTRFYYMIPITSQSSKRFICRSTSFINSMETVLKKSLSLLPLIMEVSFQDGEIWKSNLVQKRSVQPFILGRPYHSCDRASNENCNGLIRYFIKKGTDINTISKEKTIDINNKINQKKRKILGYLPAEHLFLEELAQIGVTENTIFYKI